MGKDEVVSYWFDSAREDRKVALDLFRLGHYSWCLFMWHLVIEKILKGSLVKMDLEVVHTHDLMKLAKRTNFKLSEKMESQLDEITTFNLEARYQDYKLEFYKKADKEYSKKWSNICEKIYQQLLSKNG